MKDKSTKLEYRRLLRVATEYEKKGYDVIMYPKGGDRPNFLKNFQPDMIAHKGKDFVVIEVKSQKTLKGQSYLAKLASAVENHPQWRFELIITNPRKRLKIDPATRLISFREIEERMRVAQDMLNSKQYVAAFLLAWTAIEAKMRIILKDLGKDVEDIPPMGIIKTIYSLGLISRKNYDSLEGYFKLRNLIVHGFEPLKLDSKMITKLEVLLRQLGERINPRVHGKKFCGNINKKEVHDLDNETTLCWIDEIIAAGHAKIFYPDTLKQANREGYDNCAYCIGRSKR